MTAHQAASQRLRHGVRLGAGAGFVVFIVGLSFGAAARLAGWGVVAPTLFSALTFSGSAQFTLLTGLASGSAIAAIVAATLINARYVVMSVALNDSLHGNRVRRALHTQALCDASFVIGHQGGGRFDIITLWGASLPQWVGWVTGTWVGAVLAPSASTLHSLGGDVAFPAFFAMLAMTEARRGRPALVVALVGAALAAGLVRFIDPGTALLTASLAAVVGLRVQPGPNHRAPSAEAA